MSPYLQHTIGGVGCCSGPGIHTGRHVNVRLAPAPANSGIVFVRMDVNGADGRVPASAEAVSETRLGTTISNFDGVSVSTIEHLMAAFAGLSIDNVLIELDGPEMPIMDGSSEPFLGLIDDVGRRPQGARRRYVEILEEVEVIEDDRSARLTPAEGFELAFEIDFENPVIGHQSLDLLIDEQVFRTELSAARTFGFLHEVDALRAAGLARGGTLDNVVVIDGDTIMNTGGLRRADEFVRHKALDALGDLYVLGAPIIGRYEGVRSGHSLNNALARRLGASPGAWRWSSARQTLAQAV